METPTLTKIVTDQAIAFISKSSPFGHIPVVNSIINSIVAKTISIVVNNTVISDYSKVIEDDLNKKAIKAKDIREKLNKAVTAEDRQKHENELKETLRDLFDFRNN